MGGLLTPGIRNALSIFVNWVEKVGRKRVGRKRGRSSFITPFTPRQSNELRPLFGPASLFIRHDIMGTQHFFDKRPATV